MEEGSTVKHLLGLIVAGSVWIVGGCKINSDNTKIQYVPDMADFQSLSRRPGSIAPPDGSISVNAILYPTDPNAMDALQNPLPANDENLVRGKEHYERYCKNCHG